MGGMSSTYPSPYTRSEGVLRTQLTLGPVHLVPLSERDHGEGHWRIRAESR